ncbi:PAS domain S-box protein [Nitratireductor luteus]|uniref:PAS domain S-box protein n=1 Tax=Nitratireductor luteus TaxID=2976980 RepID=UPI0022408916|nr:PAS domain S-box protein [Nitratireductor luteus]
MASASYAFLDIAVLDAIRERFAKGDALAVLSPDLDEVLWANGAGAALVGHDRIEAAIGAAPRLPAIALRQLQGASGIPEAGRERPVGLRMTSGLRSRVVNVLASSIILPRGERAVLIALPFQAEDANAAVIEGFDEPGHFAGLLDGEGNILAASEGFGGLDIDDATLRALVSEVRGEDDRLVKKRIEGNGSLFPAGIARLTEEPARHLLVVVDDRPVSSDEPAAPSAEPEAGETDAPAEEAEPEPQPEQASAVGTVPEPASPKPVAPEDRTVRFSWRTDADGRFSALSEEFAEAMGAPAADIIGRRFRDVSNTFGLDEDGIIVKLLDRRETWSGRTVMWPLSGTELKVPVDLAALPTYGRDRTFEGFRGFGIVRLGQVVADPERIGLALVQAVPPEQPPEEPQETAEEATAAQEGQAENGIQAPAEQEESPKPLIDPFLGETPAIRISEGPERRSSDKVIRLAELRDGGLSASERTAFREIGDRLRRASDALAERGKPDPASDALDTGAGRGRQTPEQEPPLDASAGFRPVSDISVQPPKDEAESSAAGTEEAGEPPPEDAHGNPTADAHAETTEASLAEDDGGEDELAGLPSEFAPAASAGDAGEKVDVALFAGLPLPILVHSGDRMHYGNPEFFAFTGYPDLDTLAAQGGMEALFDEPQEAGEESRRARLKIRKADGTSMPVEAHLQSVSWGQGKALMLALKPAMPEPETQPTGAEEREIEARLVEMRAIVDTATDGIAVLDKDGNIRSINRPAEALFGFDAENVTGKPFTTLFAIESQRTVQDYVSALSDHGVASVLNDGRQVIGREAKGRFIPLFITIGRLPNDSGYCAVLRDITQWKRAEEELTQARAQAERASSQKSEFLARVSHEIRTPLNAIIGFSELMVDEKFGPIGNDRYRDYLRDIKRSGNHVLDLVNDLLDISKIEAGQQEMHYEAVSLNEALGQTVAMMQPQANSERVIIRSSFASRLPEVVADLRSVKQIAINLLSNAIRFTPAGGQVIVSTAYNLDGSVVLRVRDTGVGMSAAELDEALKPFKQINTLKRKRGDGTGLGLPLTRAMVEANRARFTINSKPGEGTLVEVVFPPTRVLAD